MFRVKNNSKRVRSLSRRLYFAVNDVAGKDMELFFSSASFVISVDHTAVLEGFCILCSALWGGVNFMA